MSLMNAPHVSVLMSVYNGQHFIKRSVIGILAQTYSNFELILIDDGSTDGTAELVNSIQDDRIRFYQQANMGLTKTLNKALSLARGRLIARHDADDFSIVTRFMRQIEFMEMNLSVGLLGSSCFIQPEKYGLINEVYDYPEFHEDIVDAFPFYNPFVHGSMMIRRDLIESVGGYNEQYRYVQDYELWSRLLPKTRTHNLKTPLYVRSVHSQTSEVSVNKQPIFDEIKDRYVELSRIVNMPHSARLEIKALSLYPTLTVKGGWNRSIADTYFAISNCLRQHGLPFKQLLGHAALHWPWALFRHILSLAR